LEVFDTSSGELVGRTANRDPVNSTVTVYSTRMAISSSGRTLYILKAANTIDALEFYVAAFDTLKNTFLPDQIPLPACRGAVLLLPTSEEQKVDVACSGVPSLDEITFRRPSGVPRALVMDGYSGREDRQWGVVLSLPRSDKVGLIASDGSRFMFDRLSWSARKVSDGTDIGMDVGMRPALTSKAEEDIYFSVAQAEHSYFEACDTIVRADPATLESKAVLRTRVPYFSMAMSADEDMIYTVNPEQASITVISLQGWREIRRLPHVGQKPVFAIGAP
jgi:hypothetical protein